MLLESFEPNATLRKSQYWPTPVWHPPLDNRDGLAVPLQRLVHYRQPAKLNSLHSGEATSFGASEIIPGLFDVNSKKRSRRCGKLGD